MHMANTHQIVQCLQCARYKSSLGQWFENNLSPKDVEISHTYCPDCISILQERLIASRDFGKWPFERQVDYLKDDILNQDKKFDRVALKNYLEEFFCLDMEKFEDLYEALKPFLANAVCPRCHQEVDILENHSTFGHHVLHPKCHKEIQNKIKIIEDNNWDKSDKFSAYLDLLKIEKALRPTIKDFLKKKTAENPLV